MNSVNLIGNLGKDPEMKYFDSGSKVTKFSIALKGYSKKEQKETTDWVNCEAWNNIAETIGEYCKSGHKIGIEGSLKTQQWTDDAGNKKSKTYVLVNRIEFLTKKDVHSTSQPKQNAETDEPIVQFGDEEIPF